MANERSSGSGFFSAKDEKSVLAGAHDYFVNNVLPSDIKACVRRIKAPTLYVNNHDETFLLVRSGRGTLTVNGLDYRLKPNTLINLGPFHRYRYLPDDGEVLEIAESRMNSGTYVYLVANPYMKFEQFYVPSEPPVVAQVSRPPGHTPAVVLLLRNDNILTLVSVFFRALPPVFLSLKTTKNKISQQISWQN